jgi:preprotein translocase subunit SecG
MHTVLVVVHLMIVLALVATVLLQRSEGGALGIGGGGGGFMTGRGKTSALTRTTAWLAAGFFATSIALAIMAGTNRIAPSIIQRAAPPAESSAPAPGGGLMDNLKQQQQAPAAPVGPQAPISGAPQPPAAPAP